MRKLYPPIKPFKKGRLKVSEIHSIYYEEAGNPAGVPVVFLHGGPGSQCKPRHRQYFNPRKYRIVLFDQRGCGRSTPAGELRQNTTWDLVEDIEKLRKFLEIKKWHVFGSSWGSTLALAYAENYPGSVSALILHAVGTSTPEEAAWLHGSEAKRFYPDAWELYSRDPAGQSKNSPQAFWNEIFSSNKTTRNKAIRSFQYWDGIRMDLTPQVTNPKGRPTSREISDARIYAHYLKNKAFLEKEQLIKDARKLTKTPGVIIQGRYDMIYPPITAWKLHKAWPQAQFRLIECAGHRTTDPRTIDSVIEYTDRLLKLGKPSRK